MKLHCIIIEDQPPAQRILKKFVHDIGSLELEGIFSDALAAMDFLKENKVDLMFLDINLPKLSGIEFLKTLERPPSVILTTAFSEYALDGYDLNVVDYLLKPFSFQRFVQAVNKVHRKADNSAENESIQNQSEIYVKSGHDYIKVSVDEIFAINSDSDYTEIRLNQKKILSSESLRHWLDVLGTHHFVQLHRSYIINKKKIERVSGNQVYLMNGMSVPIGRAYKEEFMKGLIA